jgi:hypothetical protein
MSVGALGNVHCLAVIGGDGAVDQILAALAAGHGADTHSTFLAGVYRHWISPLLTIDHRCIFTSFKN